MTSQSLFPWSLCCAAAAMLCVATPALAQTPPPAKDTGTPVKVEDTGGTEDGDPLFTNDPTKGTKNPTTGDKPGDKKPNPKTTKPAPDLAQSAILPKGPRYRDFGCGPDRRDRRYVGYYFICVDVRGGRIAYADIIPSYGKPLLPNKPILVKIIHESTQRVAIESEGQLGLFAPGVDSGRNTGSGLKFGAGDDKAAPIEWVVTQATLPPFRPSREAAKVKIRLFDEESKEIDTAELSFLVQYTYSGALRAGVAPVFLGAVDGRYAARRVAGSQQLEVVSEPADLYNLEVVLGYAAFLEEGGRPATGCKQAPWCFAPYVGLGVLSQGSEGGGGFKFLSSLHLGVEWEPVRNFSIAATLVGRRVDRLASGFQVGGPVLAGEEIITQRFGLGAGVVFNLSPDFFNFARNSALGGSL